MKCKQDENNCTLVLYPDSSFYSRFRIIPMRRVLKINDRKIYHNFCHHLSLFQEVILEGHLSNRSYTCHNLKKTFSQIYTLETSIKEYKEYQYKILFLCWVFKDLPKDVLQIIIGSVL